MQEGSEYNILIAMIIGLGLGFFNGLLLNDAIDRAQHAIDAPKLEGFE